MPTSRSPFGVTIAPLPFPDFQTDINKQLSFWNTMQAMQNRAAGISGGGRVPRDENGLTPYQRMQFEEKRRKEEAKAAEAEAKKNVMLGLDPVTKEPIVYRNESGQNLTQKDRDRLLADELQRRLRTAAGSDAELNKALGELNSGAQISTQRRSELQRVVRDRTKALGREYGIDDRATFDAIIGPSQQILKEQKQALKSDSFLDTVWAGMRKGGNALYYAATMPFMSDAERLEAAEQMRKEQEAITRSSPTLQERALVEAEAAREGKDVGYMQAAQANLASNIGASVADTVTSFAPAIAAGMIPVVGTYAAPLLAGGIGAGLNQVSQAARVEADPNLTEAQKQQALSYSDPGFVATTGVGGVTGLLMPGGVGSGIVRGAGNAAFRRAAAAGPINPATVPGLTGRALRAGARATERANAPRSLAALSRDVPVNMAENAGLMAANTVGANMAYNASVGQPLTQGAMEGVGRAAMEGAVVGVPFGIGRTLRRRAAPTVQATTEGTVSSTGEPANTQPVSIFEQAMKANTAAQEWKRDLLKTVVNPRKVKTEAADKLIAEYLDTVDTTVDGWRDEMSARLVSIDDLPRWNKMNDNSAAALRKVVDTWKGALDDGTITEKIASNYQRPAEGESRLASYVGELERVRAKRAAGQDTRDDSSMEADSAKRASDAASGDSVQGDANNSETPGRRTGGTTAPHVRAIETDAAALAQAGILPSAAKNKPASSGSTGARGKSPGNGAGKSPTPTVGGDGSESNANATGGGEQSVEPVVISIGEPQKVGATKRPIVIQDGVFTDSNFMKYDATFVRLGSKAKPQWFWKPEDSKKNYKVSPEHNARLEQAYQQKLGETKSTNPKGEVKESRFLPRQQYSSAGTSRRQIPESFKKIPWATGTRNLDIGAGAFELGTDYLRSRGVENTPFDPYNRTRDVNNAALDTLRNGEKYDTVTVANLLNVVQEPEIRDNIIKQAAHSVKPDGKAYFQVYESDRSGVGRQTKTGGTDDNWQNARTLKSYQPDIERHFGKVESKDGMLIASEPKDPGPVEWQLDRDGDTVRQHLISRSYQGYNGSRDEVIHELPDGSFIEYRDVTVDDDPVTVFHLNRLYVAPESRGKGVSKALEQWAMKHIAKEHPNAVLYAEAEPFTPDATLSMEQLLRSYEKRGAVEIPNSKGETFSPDRLLDPDKPLSQQPKYVREHLKDVKLPSNRPLDISDTATGNQIFDEILDRWHNLYAPAASALHEAGIYFHQCGIPIKFEIRNGKIVKPNLSAFDYKYVLGGEEPSFRGWWESDNRAQHSFAEAPVLSDKLIEKCFRTPEEKALLERLRNGTDDIVVRADGTGFDDMGSYYDVVRQVADIILARFPGMKKRNVELYTPYSDNIATYSLGSGDIGLNAADIFSSPDPAATILRMMGHELGGHGESRELAPPSARTDLYRTAFSSVDSQTQQMFKDAYMSRANEASMANDDYFGEEIYSEVYAGNPEQFLADTSTESARQNVLTFFNTVVQTPTERTEAMQKVLTFLAHHADATTFKDVAVEALLSSKEHTSLFLGSFNDFLSFLDSYSRSANSAPEWTHLVSDYRNITELADVPRNKETLRIYLDELLDPETELDVFKRQSVVC